MSIINWLNTTESKFAASYPVTHAAIGLALITAFFGALMLIYCLFA